MPPLRWRISVVELLLVFPLSDLNAQLFLPLLWLNPGFGNWFRGRHWVSLLVKFEPRGMCMTVFAPAAAERDSPTDPLLGTGW
uniref:Secreted protein n=1 Tax=Physcomitrium patens TaxID=3218 RepID=A0A2K1K3U8_PHYPA|nr:hypothetical protein PHYPA_012923 [Physcomitrium patens]